MYKYIKKIQNKPKSFRQLVTLSSSLFITMLVIGVWILTTYYGGTSKTFIAKESSVPSPVDSLWAIAIGGFQNIKNQFQEVKSKVTSVFNESYIASISSSTSFLQETPQTNSDNGSQLEGDLEEKSATSSIDSYFISE